MSNQPTNLESRVSLESFLVSIKLMTDAPIQSINSIKTHRNRNKASFSTPRKIGLTISLKSSISLLLWLPKYSFYKYIHPTEWKQLYLFLFNIIFYDFGWFNYVFFKSFIKVTWVL